MLCHVWLFVDYSLPGSSVLGISQARILQGVAIPFSRGPSQLIDQTQVACLGSQILYHQRSLSLLYYILKSCEESKTWVLVTRRKCFFPIFSFFSLYLDERMDISWNFGDDHFTKYVKQPFIIYALNLGNDIRQLLHNKTGKIWKYSFGLNLIGCFRKTDSNLN